MKKKKVLNSNFKKFIIIKSSGHIHALGGVVGPVNTPFLCSIQKIFNMINTGIEVYEVLEDKSQLLVTLDNYNLDNSLSSQIETKSDKKVVSASASVKEEPKEEVKEEEVIEETVEETEEEVETEEKTEEKETKKQNSNNYSFNNNKNKKNKK